MAERAEKQYPAMTGLIWHRDPYYSFFIPVEWTRLEWADKRQGVMYGPDPTDPLTVFAVDLKDLGTPLTAEDLEVLSEGFLEGLERLPGIQIASCEQKVTGSLLELEAKYTFREGDKTLKRWVRVLYYETRQVALTAQGATPEKYDYWLPIFFEAMMTARVHNTIPSIDSA